MWRCHHCGRAYPHGRLLAGHLIDTHGEGR
jgi:hypothetical protein